MKCIKCGETSESEFYPSQTQIGNYRCKSCIKEANALYWRNHPKSNNANSRRWYANNSKAHYEWRLKYVQSNPQRHRAQCYAYREFPVAQVCEIEGCFELGERHHDNYDKPYDIKWLCRKHHMELSR